MSHLTDHRDATAPASVMSRMATAANDRGARLTLAARDARTIAGMLDNHGRPESAQFLRRSGERGEQIGRHLSETDEAGVRRAVTAAGAALAGLVVIRRIRA